MTELEQLLEDYYEDNKRVAELKYKWLDPGPVTEKELNKAQSRLRQMKSFLNERENNGKSKKSRVK